MGNITLTKKVKLGIYVPNSITDEKERKEYKDFVWNILRNINRQNFEFHNILIKKLIEIDSILQGQLSNDDMFIQIRNTYYQDKKNKTNQSSYFKYIQEKRNDLIESYGYKNLSGYIYKYLVQYIKNLPEDQQYINSYTYCAINQNVVKKYIKDLIEVDRGNKNIGFYKNTQPIPINIKAQSIVDENGIKTKNLGKSWFEIYDNTYVFKFKSANKHNIELYLYFGRDKSNNKIMVDRIINNDPNYKLCDSDIQIINNEIILLLSIKQFNTNKETTPLDPEKILGVDLGMKCAAYVATNNSNERKQIGSKEFVLLKTKLAIEKDKKTLQKNSTFSKGGHGRKRKLQKLDEHKTYEKNFRNTFNHQISSDIIKTAIDWNCGQINVEDLSKIPLIEKNKRVLRNWAYFDLLNKIQYKGKINNIVVNKVNPAYTSQKCSVCGEKGNRTKQDTFICMNPNCEMFDIKVNADHNAAINIAKSVVESE